MTPEIQRQVAHEVARILADQQQLSSLQEKVAAALAIGLMGATVISTVFMFFVPIPQENQTIVGQGYGGLITLLGIVVGFFYGTSTGNKKDKDIIASQAETIHKAQTTLSAVTGTPGEVTLQPGAHVEVKAEDTK